MSKTSQREQSKKQHNKDMYNSGYCDGLNGRIFKWKRHPEINQYRNGYNKGEKERLKKQKQPHRLRPLY